MTRPKQGYKSQYRWIAPPKTQLSRLGWTGWKDWIIPAHLLRAFLIEKNHLIDAPLHPSLVGENAWRDAICKEIASITRGSEEAAKRRLYGVMSGEQRIINVSFAEAIFMSMGLDIDRDSDIPTMPGNRKHAIELLKVRAEAAGVELCDDVELERLARNVLRLCALILNYPHNQSRLQDLAPFDCLRPPK